MSVRSRDISLTKFQLQVLRMVAKGKGKDRWNWHDIAILVIPISGEDETSPFPALEQLKVLELVIQFFSSKQPLTDTWEITPLGEEVLQNYADVELF